MNDIWLPLLILVLVWGLPGGLTCAWLAGEKGRSSVSWFFVGFLFGWLALLTLGFAPSNRPQPVILVDDRGEPLSLAAAAPAGGVRARRPGTSSGVPDGRGLGAWRINNAHASGLERGTLVELSVTENGVVIASPTDRVLVPWERAAARPTREALVVMEGTWPLVTLEPIRDADISTAAAAVGSGRESGSSVP